MNKFCSNCGKELKEGADICLNCGVLINNNIKLKRDKVPGRGLSIAGMVLGILAMLIALGCVSEFFEYEYLDYYYSTSEIIADMFVYFAISITGLVLSIIGFIKTKSGFNISGIILNSVANLVNIIILIYIIFNI